MGQMRGLLLVNGATVSGKDDDICLSFRIGGVPITIPTINNINKRKLYRNQVIYNEAVIDYYIWLVKIYGTNFIILIYMSVNYVLCELHMGN